MAAHNNHTRTGTSTHEHLSNFGNLDLTRVHHYRKLQTRNCKFASANGDAAHGCHRRVMPESIQKRIQQNEDEFMCREQRTTRRHRLTSLGKARTYYNNNDDNDIDISTNDKVHTSRDFDDTSIKPFNM